MTDRLQKKGQGPTDINQLAKAIVDLATGNPILEDPPVELKKRPLIIRRQDEMHNGSTRSERRKDIRKKSVQTR
jgi:hypothetical protein